MPEHAPFKETIVLLVKHSIHLSHLILSGFSRIKAGRISSCLSLCEAELSFLEQLQFVVFKQYTYIHEPQLNTLMSFRRQTNILLCLHRIIGL